MDEACFMICEEILLAISLIEWVIDGGIGLAMRGPEEQSGDVLPNLEPDDIVPFPK
jgi:hypothetical protein